MNSRRNATPVADILAKSEGVLARARMINAALRNLRIDCAHLDTLAGIGTGQLAQAQEMVRTGDRPGLQSLLYQFSGTVTHLRDAYRMILIREDLPAETANGVLSIAQSLDVTAVLSRMAGSETCVKASLPAPVIMTKSR